MQNTIGNWLLAIGVAIGALAAAGSKKAYRVVDLDPTVDLSAEVLYETVEHQRTPGEDPLVIAEGGQPLDVVAVTRLKNANVERVRVRYPARDAVELPVADAGDRLLAEPVVIEGETEVLKAGRILTAALVVRARDAGVEALEVVSKSDGDGAGRPYLLMDAPKPTPEDAAVGVYDERFWEYDEVGKDWKPIVGPNSSLIGKGNLELAQDIELPRRFEKNTYLKGEQLEVLSSQGTETVAVKTRAPFTWSGWTQRWWFLAAVLIVAVAIALKRGGGPDLAADETGVAPADGVRAALGQVVSECEQLAANAPTMDADALHRAIDPISAGALYRVVEGREAVNAALGLGGFAEVYGPLASGERLLNRAWSAAVDGSLEEARVCAQDSVQHFREALAKWPEPR